MCLEAQYLLKEKLVTSHFTTEHEQAHEAANTDWLMHCNLSFYLSLEQFVLLQYHTAITVLSDAGRQY